MPEVFAAFSGGKDSTAMVLRMAEIGESFTLLFTPAGNEPPEVFTHIDRVRAITGMKLVQPDGPDLFSLIEKHKMLPNHRARWCTRQIKIEPCQKYLSGFPGATLCVGFRADEDPEDRKGGRYYDVEYRAPMREWGWGIAHVLEYLDAKGITVPERTDCMLCFGQQLGEWFKLWKYRPEEYERGVQLEQEIGHTLRSDDRDTWPASLKELRERFERGERPRNLTLQEEMLFECSSLQGCRICKL